MNTQDLFVAEVTKRSEANMHGSWGTDDSIAVIEQLADEAYSSGEGFDAIRSFVADLVNPSAFRQKLEKLPTTNPAHIVPSGRKRGTPSAALGLLAQQVKKVSA